MIEGNYIGTDLTGTHAVANTGGGIVSGGGDTIGGTIAGARNLISGNSGDGLDLYGGDLVEGNYVGTDVNGGPLLGLGIAGNGINVQGAISTQSAVRRRAPETSFRAMERRECSLTRTSANLVQGNFIGTNAAGSQTHRKRVRRSRDHGRSANTIGGLANGPEISSRTTAAAGSAVNDVAYVGRELGDPKRHPL